MKTSEIKKIALQKTIKLKLQNKLGPQYFTSEDSIKVQKVCESLSSIKQQQKCLSQHILELNYQLMTKLKYFIQQPQISQENQQSRLQFRIGKNTRKTDRNFENYEYLPEIQNSRFSQMKPLAPFSQNRSELIFRRENYRFEEPRESTIKKMNIKKLPKLNGQKINDMQCQVQPSEQKISIQKQVSKITSNPNKMSQIQIMKERETALIEQNKKLRSMLISIQECPQNKTNQNNLIDFQICLSFEEIEKGKAQGAPIMKIEIEKEDQKQTKNKNKDEKDKKQDCIRVSYLEELVSHLQLMIVSQTQQIQNLRQKLAQAQKKPLENQKSSRWTSY